MPNYSDEGFFEILFDIFQQLSLKWQLIVSYTIFSKIKESTVQQNNLCSLVQSNEQSFVAFWLNL